MKHQNNEEFDNHLVISFYRWWTISFNNNVAEIENHLKFSFTCTAFLHNKLKKLTTFRTQNFWQIYCHLELIIPEVRRAKLSCWAYPKLTTSSCLKLVEISKSRHVGAEGNNCSCQCSGNNFPPFLWFWVDNRVPSFRTILLFKQNSVSYELLSICWE